MLFIVLYIIFVLLFFLFRQTRANVLRCFWIQGQSFDLCVCRVWVYCIYYQLRLEKQNIINHIEYFLHHLYYPPLTILNYFSANRTIDFYHLYVIVFQRRTYICDCICKRTYKWSFYSQWESLGKWKIGFVFLGQFW